MDPITIGSYEHTVLIDTKIYPVEGVQMAARSFLDEAFFLLHGAEPEGAIRTLSVGVKPRRKEMDSDDLLGRFINEMNRQCLRIHSNRRTRKIRTQVIGRTLASARTPVEEKGKNNTPEA